MLTNLDDLTSHALALSPEDRIVLAQRLWESVEGQVDEDEELFQEIDRRSAEMDSGEVQTYSHEEVMRAARKVLRE